MRGRVTLAVRGFVGCVGVVALAEVLALVMGRGARAGDEYLVPMVVLYGLSGVQLMLSVVAWFRRGWGWAVWWAVATRLAAMVVVVGTEVGWALGHVDFLVNNGTAVVGELALLWAGRRVLVGREGSGRAVGDGTGAGEGQVGRGEGGGGGGGGEVLAYSRVSRKRGWVGTAVVFLGVVMVIDAVSPIVSAIRSWEQTWASSEIWEAAVATLGAGVVVVWGWRVWGKSRRGEDVGRGVEGIAVCATGVLVAGMVVNWLGGGDMAWAMTVLREKGLWLGIDLIGMMGPVVFFVMMVWGEERGEYTREGRGEQ